MRGERRNLAKLERRRQVDLLQICLESNSRSRGEVDVKRGLKLRGTGCH